MCARRRPGCAAVPSRVLGAFPRSLDAQLLVTGFDSPGKFVNECLYLFFDFFFLQLQQYLERVTPASNGVHILCFVLFGRISVPD